MLRLPVLLLLTVLFTTPLTAQETKAKSKRAQNPAFAPVEDVPGLPRVLIIGDSISIGYQVPLRELMKDKANIHRPPANCGPTTRGVENIDSWLGDGKWEVIHFNFGLHDVRHFDDQGKAADRGHRQVSEEDYEKNLDKLVARMKQTGAKLIFATTTPVPQGATGRVVGDEARYNEIARRVMGRHGVAVNDLYAFALPQLERIQLPANVHFKLEGSRELAQAVAQAIESHLPAKK